jgi:hypothetical protein
LTLNVSSSKAWFCHAKWLHKGGVSSTVIKKSRLRVCNALKSQTYGSACNESYYETVNKRQIGKKYLEF